MMEKDNTIDINSYISGIKLSDYEFLLSYDRMVATFKDGVCNLMYSYIPCDCSDNKVPISCKYGKDLYFPHIFVHDGNVYVSVEDYANSSFYDKCIDDFSDVCILRLIFNTLVQFVSD